MPSQSLQNTYRVVAGLVLTCIVHHYSEIRDLVCCPTSLSESRLSCSLSIISSRFTSYLGWRILSYWFYVKLTLHSRAYSAWSHLMPTALILVPTRRPLLCLWRSVHCTCCPPVPNFPLCRVRRGLTLCAPGKFWTGGWQTQWIDRREIRN